jgi:uridine kinase
MKNPQVILLCGGSCSGKSVFAKMFAHAFILQMDHFYLAKKDMKPKADGSYDFDDPVSVNITECAEAVKNLATGKPVTIPVYDMNVKVQDRVGTQTIQLAPDDKFIIVEGLFTFYSPLRELGNLKIYIDVPSEIRVARRMLRDSQKGRSDIDTLAWSIVVEKNHKKLIEPMKQYADLVIPFSYNPVEFTNE